MNRIFVLPMTIGGVLLHALLQGCSPTTSTTQEEPVSVSQPNELLYSFAFVGCNRVGYGDRHNPAATNATTANLAALKRTFTELAEMETQPELLFFLGDLVEGEKSDVQLEEQLPAWVRQFEDTAFSPIATTGIELVAVPGNHEMLYYDDDSTQKQFYKREFPLAGATDLWMEHMAGYMPTDRNHVGGADSLNNRATFAFRRGPVGFVVMNTDTYNEPTAQHPKGQEGQAPVSWINEQIEAFAADSSIQHVFVLGHKPYYVDHQPDTGHSGFADGPPIWEAMQAQHATAMLSAHAHNYNRMQPTAPGTYQIIAGNGGSPLDCSQDAGCTFFGYSIINIWSDGSAELRSLGWTAAHPYYAASDQATELQDSTILVWSKNQNPYTPPKSEM